MTKKIKETELIDVEVIDELDDILIETETEDKIEIKEEYEEVNIDIEIIEEHKIISYKVVKILDVNYGMVIVNLDNENKEVKIDLSDFQLNFIMDNKHKYIGKHIKIELENDNILPIIDFNPTK